MLKVPVAMFSHSHRSHTSARRVPELGAAIGAAGASAQVSLPFLKVRPGMTESVFRRRVRRHLRGALLRGVTMAKAALLMGKRCDNVAAVHGNKVTGNGCRMCALTIT